MDKKESVASFQSQLEELQRLMFKENRLETFNKNWKELKNLKYCTSSNFAAAGFFNHSTNEYSDNVKCFACQKELSNWEENDDPWEEHVKRGSKCPFVLFKNKENATIADFLQLQYEIKKIILNNYFECKKDVLKEKEKKILKSISSLKKNKK